MVREVKFADIAIGDTASFSKTITEHDVYAFAGLSGNFNPVHVDEEFARNTRFKGRIAHGLLAAGLISTVIGTALPGANAIYLAQELVFKSPVMLGDTLTAQVEVVEKIEAKKRIIFKTSVTNQNGVVVIEGKDTIYKD